MDLDFIAENVSNIQFNWFKEFGYFPTKFELQTAYTDGTLLLTDNEEDCLIQYFEIEKI